MNKILQFKGNKYIFISLTVTVLLCLSNISLKAEISRNNSFADLEQIINEKKVTLNHKNKGIKIILNDVKKQTKIGFAINDDKIEKDLSSLTIKVKNVTIKEALDKLFKGTAYTYKITSDHILISKRVFTATQKSKKVVVSGLVLNEYKDPVIGATIIIKGTESGAITDAKGRFIITPHIGSSIEVTYVGNKPLKYTITKAEKNLTLSMSSDALALDNVIVDGFNTIDKFRYVGVAQKVNAEDLDMIDATKSLEQMLEGKVSDMVISNPSGAVGQRQRVRVRGTSSILGNQEPVWVVDGIIQNDPLPFKTSDFNALADGSGEGNDMIKDFIGNAISWLNPSDIENITILKDVSATVLYGVKAANGVIVITTKRGKSGRGTAVNYSVRATHSRKFDYDDLYLMNGSQRVDVDREMVLSGRATEGVKANYGYEYLYNKFIAKELTRAEFDREVTVLENTNTDWLGRFTQNQLSQTHNLSISGGSESTTYRASLSYATNKGQVVGNSRDNYGINVGITTWPLKDVISLDLTVRANVVDTEGFNGINGFTYARETVRSVPDVDENGDPHFYVTTANDFLYNQENEMANRSNTNRNTSTGATLAINFNLAKGLKLNINSGFGLASVDGEAYSAEESNYITAIRKYEYGTMSPSTSEYKNSELPFGGQLSKSLNNSLNWNVRAQLNYSLLLNKKHLLGFAIGSEMSSMKYTGYDSTVYGYMEDKGKIVNLPARLIGPNKDIENKIYDRFKNTITDRLNNTLGVYTQASYSYDQRYNFTASIRSDASNTYGQSAKTKFLPVFAVGFRWNINNEAFMQSISEDYINDLALNASFGYQGNIAENYGPDLIAKYGYPDTNFGTIPLEITRLPYADLTWEKVRSVNLGFSMGLFKNRIQANLNYYFKETLNAIVSGDIPYEWGMPNIPINDGTIINQGWGVNFSANIIRTKEFNFSLSWNFSGVFNEVKSKLMNERDWNQAVSGNLVKNGYPISTVWGFYYDGINPENGFPMISLNRDSPDFDPADATTWLKELGKIDPFYSGGFSPVIRYKQFTFNVGFTVNLGGQRFLSDYMFVEPPKVHENLSKDLLYRWRRPGDEKIPGIMPGLPHDANSEMWISVPNPVMPKPGFPHSDLNHNIYELYNYSEERFINASFFKCNNLGISYRFSESILNRIKMSNITLNLSVSNPFYIVSKDFKGMDPEIATGSAIPNARTVSFGLSFGF